MLLADVGGRSFFSAPHCMSSIVNFGTKAWKVLQYQWIVLWTGFEPAVLCVHVDQNHRYCYSCVYPKLFFWFLAYIVIYCRFGIAVHCLQWRIVLCCWIGGVSWVLVCVRERERENVWHEYLQFWSCISVTHWPYIVIVTQGRTWQPNSWNVFLSCRT
jgi:hypothetical protein